MDFSGTVYHFIKTTIYIFLEYFLHLVAKYNISVGSLQDNQRK